MASRIGYWAATALLILPMGLGGILDIIQPQEVAEVFARLGYPAYFGVMLGISKLLGLAVILSPGLVRIKEWAYAGMGFDLVAAFVSHTIIDGLGPDAIPPIVCLVILIASYVLRPANRLLPGPSFRRTSAASTASNN